MRFFAFSILLTACGGPRLSFSSVDGPAQTAFYELQSELGALGVVLSESDDARLSIVADNVLIAKHSSDGHKSVMGYFDASSAMVVPVPEEKIAVGERQWLIVSEKGLKGILAHELGHAFGLGHADHGIMLPEGSGACVDHEAACLLGALKENGKMR